MPSWSQNSNPRLQKMARAHHHITIWKTPRDLQIPSKAFPSNTRQKCTDTDYTTWSNPKWQWHLKIVNHHDGSCGKTHPYLQLVENNLDSIVRKRSRQPPTQPTTYHSFIRSWLQSATQMVLFQRLHNLKQKCSLTNRQPRRRPNWLMCNQSCNHQSTLFWTSWHHAHVHNCSR